MVAVSCLVYHKGVERSNLSFPKNRQDGRSGAEADLLLVLLPRPGSPPAASAPVSSCCRCTAPAGAPQARKQLSLRLRRLGGPAHGKPDMVNSHLQDVTTLHLWDAAVLWRWWQRVGRVGKTFNQKIKPELMGHYRVSPSPLSQPGTGAARSSCFIPLK